MKLKRKVLIFYCAMIAPENFHGRGYEARCRSGEQNLSREWQHNFRACHSGAIAGSQAAGSRTSLESACADRCAPPSVSPPRSRAPAVGLMSIPTGKDDNCLTIKWV